MLTCGLFHSNLVTTPFNVTGFFSSYWALSEWCASMGATAKAKLAIDANTVPYCFILYLSRLATNQRAIRARAEAHRNLVPPDFEIAFDAALGPCARNRTIIRADVFHLAVS